MKSRKLDLFLIIPLISIIVLGMFSLNSALLYNPAKFKVQIVWVCFAIVVFLFASYKNLRSWEHLAVPLFFANLILLFLVLFIGKRIGGSQRWLDLGFMNFQVSELTKVSTILFIAYRLNMKPTLQDGYKLFDVIPEAIAVTASMILIYREPDLGTSLLVGMLSFIMIMSSKINKKHLLTLAAILIITAPLTWSFMLKSYQKDRIVALATMMWSDSSELSLTSQYHTNQSIIGIGSGKLSGKGYKRGTQNILRFIPEHHTDFIFSVYAEEFGFIGVSLLFFIYLLLFVHMLRIIERVKDKFSALIIIGTVSLLWLQIFINIGMVTGILPVVGIPLPFISYGGSGLMVNSFLVGLVHNISLSSSYSR